MDPFLSQRPSKMVLKFLSSGRRVLGRTFKWDGDSAVHREVYFDIKDWQLDNLERNIWDFINLLIFWVIFVGIMGIE